MIQTQIMPLNHSLRSLDGYFMGSSNMPTFTEPSTYHHSIFRDGDGHSLQQHQRYSYFQQCKYSAEADDATQTSVSLFGKNVSEAVQDAVDELDDDEDEEEDDDEFFEEEYADAYREHMTPDSPTRLLHFIRTVTSDIQDRFARNKGQEGYCDVYEERFRTTLSGCELYYADLIALASNPEARPSAGKAKNRLKRAHDHSRDIVRSKCIVTCNRSGRTMSCNLPHRGREMSAVGLGPLEELFLRDVSKVSQIDRPTYANVLGIDASDMSTSRAYSQLPMTMRKLPNSFWNEPAIYETRPEKQYCNLTAAHTPDFTDLFNHWADKC